MLFTSTFLKSSLLNYALKFTVPHMNGIKDELASAKLFQVSMRRHMKADREC